MQIPHEITPRPDTGLYNAKLGIWLFLASEVMLFAGLFSGYVFMRLGAEPGYWPHGLLNVPVGFLNTCILIASSVTVILAWASLKTRNFAWYKKWMMATIVCGLLFLGVKLGYEYPQKFNHFGAFIKKDSLAKYEDYLGNKYLAEHGHDPRIEISGHLLDAPAGSPYAAVAAKNREHFKHVLHENSKSHGEAAAGAEHGNHGAAEPITETPETDDYVIQLDASNASPLDSTNLKANFWPKPQSNKTAVVKASDINNPSPSMFVPRHSPYFAVYFTITGLHGLHVLGGIIVFVYLWGPGASLYQRNPEHLANRVEVAGLFWHFVDLVWIFVFPMFYLL
jgi:cytochrome c oxidase subunit III